MADQIPRPWIVIPTYNEKANIGSIIIQLYSLSVPNLSILVVDDNSPDGTAAAVRDLQAKYSSLRLEVRPGKSGLGRAYIHGFGYALDHGAGAVVQMDADFSHNPGDVPRLLQQLHRYDIAIGSRYANGISVVNWPLRRLLLSTSANYFARLVTGLPYKDVTGGFRAWRGSALKKIKLEDIEADGYGFQIAMAYRAWRKNLTCMEVPIIFTERREGQSKMSRAIMWEAFWLVWKLRLFG